MTEIFDADGDETTSVCLPRVVFGSSALGNLYQAIPPDRKEALVAAWLASGDEPIVIDSAGKYGAGLALEELGRILRRLRVDPDRVRIGLKLGWSRVPLVGDEPTFEPGAWVDLRHDAEQRISHDGILDCWTQGVELLGEPYRPRMVSVHDPDEYIAASKNPAEREQRWGDVRGAYAALQELCAREQGCTLGVGVKDWRVARGIAAEVALDWVMLANCVTAYTHEPGAIGFVADLAARGVSVINSGVFNAGFLVGGPYFDYRRVSESERPELFAWREDFLALCRSHHVAPAHACIQFGLSPEGVDSVALNTVDPSRVQENLRYAHEALPPTFWGDARGRGILDASCALSRRPDLIEPFLFEAMITRGILNPAIASLVCRVRHTNTPVIADRGFHSWPTVETVDISLIDDVPTVLQDVESILAEFQIGKAWMAEEFRGENDAATQKAIASALDPVSITFEPHTDFKKRVPSAIGLIRTGDTTQYTNLIFESA